MNQDYPLDPENLDGLTWVNGRLEMILHRYEWRDEDDQGAWAEVLTPQVVRNGHLYYLNQQLPGVTYDWDGNWWPGYWYAREVRDLNNHGLILATVAPAYNANGDLQNIFHWDADGYLINTDDANAVAAAEEPALLVPVRVEAVSFYGTGHVTLRSDDGVAYGALAAVDTGGPDDHWWPVAYVRNTTPQVSARLAVGAPDGTPVEVQAWWRRDNMLFSTTVSASVSGGILLTPPMLADHALPNEVQYYAEDSNRGCFELEWEINIAGTGWQTVWRTNHEMYVTLGTPLGWDHE